MDNLEYLKGLPPVDNEMNTVYNIRKLRALEIIAEELCKFNKREDNKFSGEDPLEVWNNRKEGR